MKKNFLLLFIVFTTYGCVQEYQFPEGSTADSRVIVQCILQPEKPIELRIGRFFNSKPGVPEPIIDDFQVVVYESGQKYDELLYLGDHIYGSSDFTLVPDANKYYEIEIRRNDQFIFLSKQQHFPKAINVTSSNLLDTIWSTGQFSKQITLKGNLKLQKEQNINYLGLQLNLTKYKDSYTSHGDTIQDTIYHTTNNMIIENGIDCSAPRIYYPFNYNSIDVSCFQPSIEEIHYTVPYIETTDSTISAMMTICNISTDLAHYYASQFRSFEGTDFFYAPQNEIKFNINTDSIVGLISTINCTNIETKIR